MPRNSRAFGAKTFLEEKPRILESCAAFQEARRRADEEHGPRSAKSFAATRQLRKDTLLQLKAASLEAYEDRGTALAMLSVSGRLLYNCCDSLTEDPELVLAAIANFPRAIGYAGDNLLDDKDFVLRAAQTNPLTPSLEFVSKRLREDREVVLTYLPAGNPLLWASTRLQGDKEVVLAALQDDAWPLMWVSQELRNDPEVVMQALKTQGERPRRRQQRNIFMEAGEGCRRDKDIILLAMRMGHEAAIASVYHLALKVHPILQMVPLERFESVAMNALAVPGEDAPILTVWVRHSQSGSCSSSNNSNDNHCNNNNNNNTSDNNNNNDESNNGCNNNNSSFHCEVSLLSGFCFTVCLSGDRVITVGDLADRLMDKLPDVWKVGMIRRVFMTFECRGESFPITAWDADRCLSDFAEPFQGDSQT